MRESWSEQKRRQLSLEEVEKEAVEGAREKLKRQIAAVYKSASEHAAEGAFG